MELSSPDFSDGGLIPVAYTGDGVDGSPTLHIRDVPAEAASLVLVVDDPDAPREEPWVHWLLWNLPPTTQALPANFPPHSSGTPIEGACQGTNDFGNIQYNGPAPPTGHGVHRYRFTLYALDDTLAVRSGASRADLDKAMEGHILVKTRLVGTYER
ncbi:MAG: YbhB/YbcL family Raf kinase inhibitor-like protein [Candidatus Thermoplasmatota archaeon]|nr:YbhB/YbcL family Raf kinase inhibitor-like protein [Candidatus Thermoplasmatota archaeon]